MLVFVVRVAVCDGVLVFVGVLVLVGVCVRSFSLCWRSGVFVGVCVRVR